MIRTQGVEPYEGSVRYVRAARDAGLRRAVVSSSANCHDVLVAAGIDDLFEARIDGVVAQQEHLRGKPAPDTFLAGAKALGLEPPAEAAVFEDALAGVEAGRAGRFGYVVGVDRVGQAAALKAHGADIVVRISPSSWTVRDPPVDLRGRAVVPAGDHAGPGPARPDGVGVRAVATGTWAGAATWTRASRMACRGPTSTGSSRCGRCLTPRRATGSRSPGRPSST